MIKETRKKPGAANIKENQATKGTWREGKIALLKGEGRKLFGERIGNSRAVLKKGKRLRSDRNETHLNSITFNAQ